MIYKAKSYTSIHSVRELLRRLGAPSELVECGRLLDRHYVPSSRYPNAWPYGPPRSHYTRSGAEKAINYARRRVEYVSREIGGSEH